MKLSIAEKRVFQKAVRAHYKKHGRKFPWRNTTDPYRILVSEIMLQQTQTERVVIKYKKFLKRFPTLKNLASASLGDVLREWSGLGYNRRAKLLHACAQEIVSKRKGVFPQTYEELKALPGIGPYTAGAILAFAFNIPVPVIETNIRTVYLQHFFPKNRSVSDTEIMSRIETTLDMKNSRLWYAMLMDYGAWIKRTHGNPNMRSKQYAKQSTFKGSAREVRGAIIRALAEKSQPQASLKSSLAFASPAIDLQVSKLIQEGLVKRVRRNLRLP